MNVQRLGNGPIIRAGADPEIGDNVNGPSLVRAPSWAAPPLGRYYLYFAHHDGDRIRMAYADDLLGPWTMKAGGVLDLDGAGFRGHVASPDVHVDEGRREVRMYFHGCDLPTGEDGPQFTRVALSGDGLRFEARGDRLGPFYFRVFELRGDHYAIAMPGVVYRSRDGLGDFERGHALLGDVTRHVAVDLEGDRLGIWYTRVGDRPERILRATVDVAGDWRSWRASEPEEVLAPERDYEGGHLPPRASRRGMAPEPVPELRDPCIFREDGRTWLLYAVAGERGIAVAEILR